MVTMQFDTLIDSYISNKAGVDKNFLTDRLAKGLQQNISQLHTTNNMKEAGIGNATVKDSHQKMRGDKISWLDKSNNNAFEQEFLELAENFIAHLNSSCYTGISDYEFHYAIYEAGSYYKKHIDQFQSDNKRKFSFINYLNDDWKETDGGQLHLYHAGGVQKIQPESKTAVFFKSSEMEHEVVLCKRSRMSISGWLKSS